jgi:integrase
MAVALSIAFAKMREGVPVNLKKTLDAAAAKAREELILGTVALPNGAVLSGVEINSPEDQAMFEAAVTHIGGVDFAAGSAPSVSGKIPLSQAIRDHLADLEAAKRANKTVTESRHALRLFRSAVGSDIPVGKLTQAHARASLAIAAQWPTDASTGKQYRGLTVPEVVALGQKKGEPEPSVHTINKHRQRLNAFFNALIAAGQLHTNPLKGIPKAQDNDAAGKTGRAFTDDELGRIFEPQRFAAWSANEPHHFWPPILALYSGARVGEVSQLYADDIERVENVWGFHINNRFPGQKLKNKQSRRFVPLAKPVLDAGFLQYVERVRELGHTRLFPALPNSTGLGFGRQVSKVFSSYVKAKAGLTDPGVAFHAFRHTFITTLDRAGVPLARIAQVTGHAGAKAVIAKFYIERETVPERVETIARFVPPVTVPKYTPGQFDASLKASPKKFRVETKPSTVKEIED